ncbi:MAG: DNA polymerase domain-containing protein, partial [Dehalococcoidia bacterium]|nr:DNA polymerase domain-containing protein [Dehalococcoidia bacterium]
MLIDDRQDDDLIYGFDGKHQSVVSVNVDRSGNAYLWGRDPSSDVVSMKRLRFHFWAVVADRDLADGLECTQLDGDLPLGHLVGHRSFSFLRKTLVQQYDQKNHANVENIRELVERDAAYFIFNPVEQFLVRSGITYFKGLEWAQIHRLCFDLETTGLDPNSDQILMIAIGDNRGYEVVLEGKSEAELVEEFVSLVQEKDPDVIEGYNLFEFDLDFLHQRAMRHRIRLNIGREINGTRGQLEKLRYQKSIKIGAETRSIPNFTVVGRELIDVLHAVQRWNATSRKLENHRLKDTAIHFGIAEPDREYIDHQEEQLAEVYKVDPDRVRSYALADVRETMGLSDLLGQSNYELAKMVPMTYQDLSVSGSTRPIDYLMGRGYLHHNHSLPLPKEKKETFQGGHTDIMVKGVVNNVLKVDVESLYPTIMINKSIKPGGDELDLFIPILKHLTEMRLDLKRQRTGLDKNSQEYQRIDSQQNALKVLVNSFYGYMGTGYGRNPKGEKTGFGTQFNDPAKSAEVTEIGRDLIVEIQRQIEGRNGTPIEVDTDGIYLSLPAETDPFQFAQQVDEMNPEISLGFDGYWEAGVFLGKKNYALTNNGKLEVKGSSLRAKDLEPRFKRYLEKGLQALLTKDVASLRANYLKTKSEIENFELDDTDLQQSKSISKPLAAYKAKSPHVQVALDNELEVRVGDSISYIKAADGKWAIPQPGEANYDPDHYLKRLNQVNRRFKEAFSGEADFKAAFNPEIPIANLQIGNYPVNQEEVAWIELMEGITLIKQGKR